MKFWERTGIVIMCCWGLYAIYEGLNAWAQAYSGHPMTISDWGTWVGAIGTVTALLGTIYLAQTETRRRKREESDRALITVASLYPRIRKIIEYVESVRDSLQAGFITGPEGFAPMIRMLSHHPVWTSSDLEPLIAFDSVLARELAMVKVQIEDEIRELGREEHNAKLGFPRNFHSLNKAHYDLLENILGVLTRCYARCTEINALQR